MAKDTKQSKDINKTKTGKIPKSVWLIALAIAVITFIVFSPSLKCGFTNLDDDKFVIQNPLVASKTIEVKKIFQSMLTDSDCQLTLISLACNYQLGNLDPKGYHLWNVLLHVINTILVFFFIFLITERNIIIASIVALFFGVHPMHVESVTWVTERKDVLFLFFFLIGLLSYLRFSVSRKPGWYIFTIVLFILSCLSKGTAVVFPAVLLLIDYLLNTTVTKKMIVEKIPHFIISFTFIGITYLLHKNSLQNQSAVHHTLINKIIFASYDLLWYVFKLIIPANLSASYPYPKEDAIPLLYYLSPVIVIAALICIYIFLKKEKQILFGLGFYFVSILLMLQLIPTGNGDFNMADRYNYLPSIGLFFVIAYLINSVWNKKGTTRTITIALTCIAAIVFSVQTYSRTTVWQNSETLWNDVIDKNPETCYLGYYNRGYYYQYISNEVDKAFSDYSKAVEIYPNYTDVYNNRGIIYFNKQKYQEALADYNKSIALDSSIAEVYNNRGIIYKTENHPELAMKDYNKSIALDTKFYLAYFNRAELYLNNKQYDLAIADYTKTLELNPEYSYAHAHLGEIAIYKKEYEKALTEFSSAIDLNAAIPDYWINRSRIYNTLGKREEAKSDAIKAQQLGMQIEASYLNELGI